jgi:hypothetical protein
MSYRVDELIEIAEGLINMNTSGEGPATHEVAAMTAVAAALTALAKTTYEQYEYENAINERQAMIDLYSQ